MTLICPAITPKELSWHSLSRSAAPWSGGGNSPSAVQTTPKHQRDCLKNTGCVYVYVYMYMCICICVYVYAYVIYMSVNIYVNMHLELPFVHIYMRTRTSILCTYICIYVPHSHSTLHKAVLACSRRLISTPNPFKGALTPFKGTPPLSGTQDQKDGRGPGRRVQCLVSALTCAGQSWPRGSDGRAVQGGTSSLMICM